MNAEEAEDVEALGRVLFTATKKMVVHGSGGPEVSLLASWAYLVKLFLSPAIELSDLGESAIYN